MSEEKEVFSKVIRVGSNEKGKRKFTVRKVTTLAGKFRRIELMNEAEKDPPSDKEGLLGLLLNAIHTVIYPGLVACTDGNLWTEQELLSEVDEDDLWLWRDAARDLNPTWFPAGDKNTTPEEDQEQDEKNA